MRKLPKILAVVALSLFLGIGSVYAWPISGEVHFSGIAEPIGGAGLENATGLNFDSAEYELGTGDFAGVPENTPVTFYDFTFDPFSAPSPHLWEFSFNAIDYSFDLENGFS